MSAATRPDPPAQSGQTASPEPERRACAPVADLLSRSRQPVYLQLATIFRRQIESGEWRAGHRIPSLEALCQQYGVARMTMHHALSQLDQEGLVVRERGRGTFVRDSARRARRAMSLPVTWDEAVAVGGKLGTQAIVESSGSVRLPEDLGMPCDASRASAYHFLRRVHHVDGRPFAFGEVYIEAELFARDAEAFRQGASVPVLDRFPGLRVSAARQRLSIVAAGAESAASLQLAVGAPVAELRRFACVGDAIAYYARIEFPTEYVCLDFDLLNPGRPPQPSG